jgi:LPS-assembly protein
MPRALARRGRSIKHDTHLGELVPGTRLIGLVVVWLSLVPVLLSAQERRQLSLGGEAPVTVFADRVEHLERDNLIVGEGNVEVEQGEVRLEADRVEVNSETGEAVAVGRVVFFDGRDRLVGERIEYNFRTGTGIVYRAQGRAEPHFFLSGNRMERFGEKAYRLTGGTFTTCEDESPAWHVRWGQANAYLDDWVWGTNASFWVGRIPLIPFIPVFAASLRKDRQTGFLMPTFGQSSEKGFIYRQPFYWAISDNMDLTLAPVYYSSRGLGLAGSYRYIFREGSRGELEGFYLRDTKLHDDRWVIGFRHEEQITDRLTLKVDIADVSDDKFFTEYGNTLDERSRIRLESNISLTQRWEKWNLFGRLFWYEDLTTLQPIELHRLPEIRASAFAQEIGVPDLYFDLESSYNNFVRDVGSAGNRIDLHPKLSYPYRPFNLFTVTPRIGFRETVYDTKVVGTKVDRGFLVEDTTKEFVSRALFETGVDLEARAYRVFDWDGFLGIQRIQHAIEPRISYNYINDVDQNDLPQFDGIDKIRGTNSFTYSLTNRVKARAMPSEDGGKGRVWELLRFTLSQTYDLENPPRTEPVSPINQPVPVPPPTPPGQPPPPAPIPAPVVFSRLSDLVADLIFEPVYGLRFRGTAAFDPYEKEVSAATTDLIYETKDLYVSFGTRHGLGGELQFIQGELRARITDHWAFRFVSNYDLLSATAVENRFELTYRAQCWAVTAAVIRRTDEDEVHFTVNLLELGQFGFGRALGFQ